MKYGTILVIDDNPSILTALEICLDETFERILTLPHPDTAPALLQQERVDVILLDMNFSLGVNSGQEGLVWLRALRRLHANIPVVLITAFADIHLAVRGLKSGASDMFVPFFTTKPSGTGIGLSLSRQMLMMQNITIALAQTAVTGYHVTFNLLARPQST